MANVNRDVRLVALLVASACAIALPPAPARADMRVINCAGAQRLANVLSLPAGGQLTIVIKGTCDENITISRDDVTLRGDPAGGAIHGTDATKSTITIEGGKRVVIDHLTVTGGQNGITGTGADFTVQDSVVQDASQNGVVARFGSTVTVSGSQILNNGLTGALSTGRHGVVITDNSAGIVINSTLSGNGGSGIRAARSSSARIGVTSGNDPGPNVIENNGSRGVWVYQASQALIEGNTIRHNRRDGVHVETAAATIAGNTIQDNGKHPDGTTVADATGITVTNAGGGRIGINDRDAARGNTISGNTVDGVQIVNGSDAYLYANAITGNGRSGVRVGRASGRSVGNNTISHNAFDGVHVHLGQYFQGQGDFTAFTPNRDTITGNGTAHSTAGGYGIVASGGASVDIRDAEISGNFLDGVGAFHGGHVILRSDHLSTPVTVVNNAQNGVNAFNGGTLDIRDATISGNQQNGISVTTHSSAMIRRTTVSGSPLHGIAAATGSTVNLLDSVTVSGNGQRGISARVGSSVSITNSTITGNGVGQAQGSGLGLGVGAFHGVALEINGSTISNNPGEGVSVNRNSTLAIGGSTVSSNGSNGIGVHLGSTASLFGGVSVTGNQGVGVICSDDSRLFGNTSGSSGNAGGQVTPCLP